MSTSAESKLPYTEAWKAGPLATQFYTRTYTPPAEVSTKAVIVFVHGFAEHIARYVTFHPLLAAKGYAVFAFDQRGFGLTASDKDGHKSKTSAYGKTCWKEQMQDIEWAINEGRKAFPGRPVVLMGHSMGGAEVLGFATQGEQGLHKSTLEQVKAIVSTSPLIHQTKPASKIVRWVGSKVGLLTPNTLIPAPLGEGTLSRDPAVYDAYCKDPLIRQEGSLRHLSDMLSKGEALLQSAFKHWPKDLPVLIAHGSDDVITDPKASKGFFEKIDAAKKKYWLSEGGFHELQNEPGDVPEQLLNEIVSFIEEHVPPPAEIKQRNPAAGASHAQRCSEGRTDVPKADEDRHAPVERCTEGRAIDQPPVEESSTDVPKAKM